MISSKKIFFTLCLIFSLSFGLLGIFINKTNAALTSCEFTCPPDSPTEAAQGRNFSAGRPPIDDISDPFRTVMTRDCGYENLLAGEFVPIPAALTWRSSLVDCECSEARGEESAETFDRAGGVCRFPEGGVASPIGEVIVPTPGAGAEETPQAIPATGIDIPTPLGTTSISVIIGRVIKGVLGVVGSIALIMFIYGGFMWLTSYGNEERVRRGKDTLIWASLGLVIIFASYTLINFVISSITDIGESGGSGKETGEGECICPEGTDAEALHRLEDAGEGMCEDMGCEWES